MSNPPSLLVSVQPLTNVVPTVVSVGGASATTLSAETGTVNAFPVVSVECGVNEIVASESIGNADENVSVQVPPTAKLVQPDEPVLVIALPPPDVMLTSILVMATVPLLEILNVPA